jgi:methylmalonyl-CoA mutase
MNQDFYHFTKPSPQEWQQQALKEGHANDPASSSRSKLWDQIQLELFYTKENLPTSTLQSSFHPPSPLLGMSPRIWNTLEPVYPENTKKANLKAINALQNGAEGLVIYMNEQMPLGELLQEILPEYIQLYFLIEKNQTNALQSIWKWAQSQHLKPDQLKGAILWSPFKNLLDGNSNAHADFDLAADLIRQWKDFPDFYPITLDIGRYSESGGTGIQELKYGLAELVELVDQLNQREADTSTIFQNIAFQTAIGDAHFAEIAKLKATRTLISELADQYQLEINPESIHLIATTSNWSHSFLDPHNNQIRQTYQTMSAILGGANSIWVKNLGGKSATDRENRTARNASTILREEALLDKVMDPAAGSYYLETLQNQIILLIKNQLNELEKEGGWLKSFSEGKIQTEIRETRKSRQEAVLEKKSIQVGVNKFNSIVKNTQEFNWEEFSENELELKPSRASYLVELQNLKSR